VKCRSAFKAHRWRSDVPDDVLAQTVWQLAVTGYDHIHVAVLIGGNEFKQTVVRRDEQIEAYVLGEVRRFRNEHLLAGVEPEWDLSKAEALIAMDSLMNPDRVGEIGIQEIGEVIAYAERSRAKGDAEKALKESRAALTRLADGHRTVLFGDELAYELAPVTKATPNLDRLAERWPDAYADCVTDKTHYQIRLAPEFRIKPGGKK
jgi:predicted phage-related endonuclease